MALQRRHLGALLCDARRGGSADEATAARAVAAALLQPYRRWCARLRVAPRGRGAVGDALLYLCLWGEASNLRHMPELMCWLFHHMRGEPLGEHLGPLGAAAPAPATTVLAPATATAPTPEASTATATAPAPATAPAAATGAAAVPAPPTFLVDVVTPLYEVVRQRTKEHVGPVEHRMTYDDLNEYFWAAGCLQWQPYASRPAGVATALSRCAKTHVEQRSWLHLFACFSRYLALVAAATFLLCDLAVSVDNGVAWY